jgi:hypothetical protein
MLKRTMWGTAILILLGGAGGQANAGFLFNSSYTPVFTFQDGLSTTTMTAAYDGIHYWTASGGSATGLRYAEYNSSGGLIHTFSPGLDFRSVFTDASGNVYARQFNDNQIYKQTAPGVFAGTGVYLAGLANVQSAVVLNSAGTGYVALDNGVVQQWNANGTALPPVPLSGFGSMAGEGNYPQNRGLAVFGNYWLTYGNGILSAWNAAGNRVDTTTLVAAGTSFDSHFSLSYTNGMLFVVDQAGGTWRGYNISSPNGVSPTPEPGSLTLLGIGAVGLASFLRRRSRVP